jgi:hypothetical protein
LVFVYNALLLSRWPIGQKHSSRAGNVISGRSEFGWASLRRGNASRQAADHCGPGDAEAPSDLAFGEAFAQKLRRRRVLPSFQLLAGFRGIGLSFVEEFAPCPAGWEDYALPVSQCRLLILVI